MRKLSLAQLAESSGISKGYIWRLEAGIDLRPSVDIVERLAKALDMPSQDLIGSPPAPGVTAEDMRFVREYLALTPAKKQKLRQLIDVVMGPKKR